MKPSGFPAKLKCVAIFCGRLNVKIQFAKTPIKTNTNKKTVLMSLFVAIIFLKTLRVIRKKYTLISF
jgi:hypothetical protein